MLQSSPDVCKHTWVWLVRLKNVCREPTGWPWGKNAVATEPGGVVLVRMKEGGSRSWHWLRSWQFPFHPTGTAMTPNFISNTNASVSLSCTCRGSGNLQEECERLEQLFSQNHCLSECAPSAPSMVVRSSGPRERKRVSSTYFLLPDQPPPQNRLTSLSLGLAFLSCSLNDPKAACWTCLGPGILSTI